VSSREGRKPNLAGVDSSVASLSLSLLSVRPMRSYYSLLFCSLLLLSLPVCLFLSFFLFLAPPTLTVLARALCRAGSSQLVTSLQRDSCRVFIFLPSCRLFLYDSTAFVRSFFGPAGRQKEREGKKSQGGGKEERLKPGLSDVHVFVRAPVTKKMKKKLLTAVSGNEEAYVTAYTLPPTSAHRRPFETFIKTAESAQMCSLCFFSPPM